MKVTGTLYWSSTAMTWDTDSWFAVSCIIFLNQWEGVDFECYVKSDSKRIHAAYKSMAKHLQHTSQRVYSQ